jgi:hypothetical protein
MSFAFILFILWLSLSGLTNLLRPQRRPLARLGLIVAGPVLLLITLVTEGWIPASLVICAALVLFPTELANLWRIGRQTVAQRMAKADYGPDQAT